MTPRVNERERDWIDVVFGPIVDRLTRIAIKLTALFVLYFVVGCVVVAVVEIYQYASALGWYAVQFVGIEGPGFVIACAIVAMLPWVRNQLRKDR